LNSSRSAACLLALPFYFLCVDVSQTSVAHAVVCKNWVGAEGRERRREAANSQRGGAGFEMMRLVGEPWATNETR
jgi:hypothetical protein